MNRRQRKFVQLYVAAGQKDANACYQQAGYAAGSDANVQHLLNRPAIQAAIEQAVMEAAGGESKLDAQRELIVHTLTCVAQADREQLYIPGIKPRRYLAIDLMHPNIRQAIQQVKWDAVTGEVLDVKLASAAQARQALAKINNAYASHQEAKQCTVVLTTQDMQL